MECSFGERVPDEWEKNLQCHPTAEVVRGGTSTRVGDGCLSFSGAVAGCIAIVKSCKTALSSILDQLTSSIRVA